MSVFARNYPPETLIELDPIFNGDNLHSIGRGGILLNFSRCLTWVPRGTCNHSLTNRDLDNRNVLAFED